MQSQACTPLTLPPYASNPSHSQAKCRAVAAIRGIVLISSLCSLLFSLQRRQPHTDCEFNTKNTRLLLILFPFLPYLWVRATAGATASSSGPLGSQPVPFEFHRPTQPAALFFFRFLFFSFLTKFFQFCALCVLAASHGLRQASRSLFGREHHGSQLRPELVARARLRSLLRPQRPASETSLHRLSRRPPRPPPSV